MVLGVSRREAVRVAGKLVDQGVLKVSGRGRERRYLPGSWSNGHENVPAAGRYVPSSRSVGTK